MNMTNAKMYESVNILSQLEEKGMLGYAVARNRQKLLDELKDYINQRDALIKEHGVDIGDGTYKVLPENVAKFFEALMPYNVLTVDVPVMQVSLEVFCSGNLTSQQMFILDWMVKEEAE